MQPVVLVMSFAEHITKPEQIISNILAITNSIKRDSQKLNLENNNAIAYTNYICNIHTKYYNIDVNLVPCTNDIAQLPAELLQHTEAVIVYFDAHQVDFLESTAKALSNLLDEHDIELGLLLTAQLCDDAAAGVTYEAAKTATKLLYDVIELGSKNDEQNLAETGYNEVLEALRNHIWSTVQYPANVLDADGQRLKVKNEKAETDGNNDDLEEQLESFEHLLRSIQNFKNVTANMDRDQLLDHAEKLAELCSDLLVEE